MPTIYHVLNWDDHFENNKSRERDECSFVCMPNKQHGLGFTRILSLPDGPAIYGIWCCMVGFCSRQRRPRGGWLTQDGHQTGTALAPDDLALLWRRKPEEIERAIDVLASKQVAWLERVEVNDNRETEPTPSDLQSARRVPAECPPSALEGNRREEKRSILADGKAAAEPDHKTKRSEQPEMVAANNLVWATWNTSFESINGRKYVVSKPAADRDCIYRLLKQGVDALEIIRVAHEAWKIHNKDPNANGTFWCKQALTLTGLAAKWNQIFDEVKNYGKPNGHAKPNTRDIGMPASGANDYDAVLARREAEMRQKATVPNGVAAQMVGP